MLEDTSLDKEFSQLIAHVIRAQSSLHVNGEPHSGVFIDNREPLHRTSILRTSGHEVVRPDMIRMLRSEPDTGAISQPEAPTRRLFLPTLQAVAPPNPFNLFVIDSPSFRSRPVT